MGIQFRTDAAAFTRKFEAMGVRLDGHRIFDAEGESSPLTTFDVFPSAGEEVTSRLRKEYYGLEAHFYAAAGDLVQVSGLGSEEIRPEGTPLVDVADVTVQHLQGGMTTQMRYVPVAGESRTTYHLWLLLQAKPEAVRGLLGDREPLTALAAREIGMALMPPGALTDSSQSSLPLRKSKVMHFPNLLSWPQVELCAARRLAASMVGLNLVPTRYSQSVIKVLYSFEALAALSLSELLEVHQSGGTFTREQEVDAAHWIALARHFKRGSDTRESRELLEASRDRQREIEELAEGWFRKLINDIRMERE